jgi:hypothetical protein
MSIVLSAGVKVPPFCDKGAVSASRCEVPGTSINLSDETEDLVDLDDQECYNVVGKSLVVVPAHRLG